MRCFICQPSHLSRMEQEVTEEQRRRLENELNSIDSGLYSHLDDDDIARLVHHKYHTRERLLAVATKETLLKCLAGGTVELLWSKLHPGAGPVSAGMGPGGGGGVVGSTGLQRLETILDRLEGTVQGVGNAVRTLGSMLRWQTWREFRYSQSNITRTRDPKFKANLVEAYGAEHGAPAPDTRTNDRLLRDSLLNVFLPGGIIIAAHLFKVCWADRVHDTLGFHNVNNLRNALLLNKFCEAAFDNGFLIFVWRPRLTRHADTEAGAGDPYERAPTSGSFTPCAGSAAATAAAMPVASGSQRLSVAAQPFMPAAQTSCGPSDVCTLQPATGVPAGSITPRGTAGSGTSTSATYSDTSVEPAHGTAASSSSTPAGAQRVLVTSEISGGEVVARFLGDLDLVATDFQNWPWGTCDADTAQKQALTQHLGGKTVRELVEGKVLTFVASVPHRPFLRCLFFQAKAVLQAALAHGRVTEEDLHLRGIDMHQFEQLCGQCSPEGSQILQTFLQAVDQPCAGPPPVAEGDQPSEAGTRASVEAAGEQGDGEQSE